MRLGLKTGFAVILGKASGRTWVVSGAKCIARVQGVPCEAIGTGCYKDSNGEGVRQLWPFTAKQGFDIVPAFSCYIRFQNPANAPGTTTSQANFWATVEASRVTQATWTTTPEDYQNTCNNFGNFGNTNVKLWLYGGVQAFQYAGLLLRRYNFQAQTNLAALNTVVTFLLPSGVSKLERIAPTPNENCQRMANAGGIGITGKVDPNTDYAYALAFDVALALAARYPNPRLTPAMITPE